MTYRDDPVPLHCPACGQSNVQPSDVPNAGRWTCDDCHPAVYFDGGADEWLRWQLVREQRTRAREEREPSA